MNEYSPIVSEFGSAEEEESYVLWLKAKVAKSLADPRPSIPHDEVMADIDKLLERAALNLTQVARPSSLFSHR